MGSIIEGIGNWGGNWLQNQINGPDSPANSGTAPGNDLAQSEYNFKYTVFPSDLGMDNNGHYMIININVPTKGVKTNGLQLGQPAGAFTQYFKPLNQVSKLDTLRYGQNVTGGAQTTPFAIPRNTRRIAESIALHMPNGLAFVHNNLYEEISLTSLAGRLGVGTLRKFSGDNSRFFGAANFLSDAQGVATAGAAILQNPINPAIEVLYANTAQRQFSLELLLAPRNEIESHSIKTIIQTLRFHAAPEINNFTYGFTWIPPADFDITFFNKGAENLNMLRINTCVLERVDLDPAPTGIYSTFRNGHPVAWKLNLGFRELAPIDKRAVLQGF